VSGEGDYAAVIARRGEIIKRSTGLDYDAFAHARLGFDYESLMRAGGYSTDDVRAMQVESGVGGTPCSRHAT
jgi:hypothetical protein